MAQGSLSVVADRICRLLGPEDSGGIGSVLGVRRLIKGLGKTISALARKLLDAEKKSIADKRLRDWLMTLEDALYDTDNLLEDLSTEALRRKTMTTAGNEMANQIRSFLISTSTVMPSRQRQKIEETKRRLDRIKNDDIASHLEECSDFKIQLPAEVTSETPPYKMVEPVMIGRKTDKDAIKKLLLDRDLKQNVTVLPIVGMGGIGKTTLARDMLNDVTVINNFAIQIWVYVSHNFDPQQILTEIAVRATRRKIDQELSMANLQVLLRDSLYEKRYLIVLDDVWIEAYENWQSLIDILEKVGAEGSKIIVTTRQQAVVGSTRSFYHLQTLDYSNSEILFTKVVGRKPETPTQIGVGRTVLQECQGLPIAITVAASILRLKDSDDEWECFLESFNQMMKRSFNRHDYDILPLLRLSYDQLCSPLKHCFAYCSLFPEDCEIYVQTLIKLWIAQGFIMEPSKKSLEETGYQYFLNLLERSFFHEAETDVKGRVTKCRMHGLMRDLAIHVADDRCSVLSSPTTRDGIDRTFHVSFNFNLFSAEDFQTPLMRAEKLRSILLPCQSRWKYRGIADQKISGNIISRFGWLRALDMHALGIKKVPKSIGKLKLLKYLDLSENEDIAELPNSITRLLNLQTLRLSSCFGLKKLPRDFKNLINLRHLEIDGCYNLARLPRGIGQLPHLQTIPQLVVSEDPSVRDDELNKVIARSEILIDKFQIKNLGHGRDMAKYLSVAREVGSLSLEWETRAPEAVESDQEKTPLDTDLFSAVKVKELTLYGFWGDRLFSDGFPSNLVKLSLWRCENCEILPPLDQLRNLKVLILDENYKLEYISQNASSSMAVFPSLQELWLTDLPKLEGWWMNKVEDDKLPSFGCLSKLVIEDCPMLDSMPLFPTLEEGLVLDTTCLEPFQLTMSMSMTAPSSSTSPPSSPLSKLKCLCIVGIDDCKAEVIMWGMLKRLRYLRFDCIPKLATLPDGLQQVTSLEELHVWRSGLQEIPKWIGDLKFLGKLVIRVCPHLKLIPVEIYGLLTSHRLEIEDCPAL